MRVLAMMMVPFVLVGCKSVVGQWEGECELDAYDVAIEMDIESDGGGDVAGEAEIEFTYNGTDYKCEGDIEGTRDGSTVNLVLDDLEDPEGVSCGDLRIEAELDGDSMEGECVSGEEDGDFEADLE